ncbi:tripartite motif-containing protein 3-like [Branchiostoma lanceolatum]|uniref:tripartite motif-containing protein 3-like n=1 Tax=Branchiostoma lanceolatum TaxID=7740 RepID=UPI0034512B09
MDFDWGWDCHVHVGNRFKVKVTKIMAAMSQSLGEQIHEELSCSICLELFTRPKVLPCQHTFCQDCLKDHVEVRTPLECPNCRQPFSLPSGGVTVLPDNYLVASLCERIIKQSFSDDKQKFKSSDQCNFHPGEQLSLYCEECNVPLCVTCLDEAHRGHGTMSLKRASQERRSSVQTLVGEGRDVVETYCSLLRDLRDKEKFLAEQKKLTESSITVAFDETVQTLTENKNGLMSKVEQRYMLNLETIQSQRDDILSKVAEMSAACDHAEQTMQQRGRTSFDQEIGLNRLVGKYKGTADQGPKEAKVAVFQCVEVMVPPLGFVTVQFISLPESQRSEAMGHDQGQPKIVKFGGKGSDQGKFDRPHGIAVSNNSLVYVSDYGNERIQCFNLQGTFLHQFPTVVSEQGIFKSLMSAKHRMKPEDVSMDRDGNLWVVGSDRAAEYAVRYTPKGKLLTKIDLKRTGRQRKISVDTIRNNIIVTETSGSPSPQGVLCVYRPDGTLERTVGGSTKMERPEYVAVNKGGHIFVSHFMDSCVYVYREDGHLQSIFGGEGSGEGRMKYPGGICTDSSGNIIVADKGYKTVTVFDKSGNFLRYITSVVGRPVAVAMAPKGQLLVTDDIYNTVTILHTY